MVKPLYRADGLVHYGGNQRSSYAGTAAVACGTFQLAPIRIFAVNHQIPNYGFGKKMDPPLFCGLELMRARYLGRGCPRPKMDIGPTGEASLGRRGGTTLPRKHSARMSTS